MHTKKHHKSCHDPLVVVVDVVVVVDSLELELDDEYPEGDDGGGFLLFDDDFERVRSALRSILATR